MRTLLLLTAVFNLTFAQAQLNLRPSHPGLKIILEQVLEDYSRGFKQLRLDLISASPQMASYSTGLSFPAAEENVINEFSGEPPVYSWLALMLTTEDYQAARKKYSSLYNDMKQMHLHLAGVDHGLVGNYGAPSPEKKFCSTVFSLQPPAGREKLRIQLSMQYVFPEWKVELTVFEKEREDNEAPETKPAVKKKPLL